MSTTLTKHLEFKVPAEELKAAKAGAAAPVKPAPLVGTWMNCDRATRGIVKIVIAATGSGVSVHAFGNCTPTPCDWGAVAGTVDAADVSATTGVAFTATYRFAFKETILTGALEHGALIVETFNRFTDGSGRSNYYSKEFFAKA